MQSLDHKLMECKKEKNHPIRSELIEEYLPFIVKQVSTVTGKYVSHENSEELSIGLLAFNEAIDRYDNDKGSFINLASLIIKSRIKDWIKQDRYYKYHSPIEEGEEFSNSLSTKEDEDELREEVELFNKILNMFNIDLETLVEDAPKHEKTRRETIDLGKYVSKDEPIVDKLYKTKKLPMKDIVLKFRASKKKLKYHRNFIISVIVVFKEKFVGMMQFIDGGVQSDQRCSNKSKIRI